MTSVLSNTLTPGEELMLEVLTLNSRKAKWSDKRIEWWRDRIRFGRKPHISLDTWRDFVIRDLEMMENLARRGTPE